MAFYIFDIIVTTNIYVFKFLWPLRLKLLLVFGLYMGVYLLIFKCLSFWLHGDCGKWEGWALKPQVNHTGWMTVVAPADRPKSVRNSCAIERICSVFVSFHLCIVCRLGVFVIRLCQISSLFFFMGFEPSEELGSSYFTCVFLVRRPFYCCVIF